MVRESSRLPYRPSALQTWSQRSLFTQDGTLGAKGVVRKLQEAGISNNTMFSPETRICLLLKETNISAVPSTTVSAALRREPPSLSGRNYHALIDAQQLAKLYMDLCKPPGKRVYWEESGVKMPGPWKRPRSIEEYFPSMDPNKKAKAP
ncbi:hypothetical protein N7536_003502 [Penicillium majusculum]|nr:hypothetical protein N7536_003502 [Penicillium majusculum]